MKGIVKASNCLNAQVGEPSKLDGRVGFSLVLALEIQAVTRFYTRDPQGKGSYIAEV